MYAISYRVNVFRSLVYGQARGGFWFALGFSLSVAFLFNV